MKTLILSALFTTSALAGTTATLLLKGTIPALLDVSISPEMNAINLPMETSQSNLKVATINERSNYSLGYKVHLSSTNTGTLKNNGVSIPYTMTYNGLSVNLATGQQFSHVFTNAATKNREVRISYIITENVPAGEYTDTITVTISEN